MTSPTTQETSSKHLAEYQRRYRQIVGVLAADMRFKLPASVQISTQELAVLAGIARSECRMLNRTGWLSPLPRLDLERRYATLIAGLQMAKLAFLSSTTEQFADFARLAVAHFMN